MRLVQLLRERMKNNMPLLEISVFILGCSLPFIAVVVMGIICVLQSICTKIKEFVHKTPKAIDI